jgi:hypothetical protein
MQRRDSQIPKGINEFLEKYGEKCMKNNELVIYLVPYAF